MIDLDSFLAAIAAGDPDAFGRWVAGAERPLRESLRSFATRVDTEAVLQESLLRTWQVAPRLEPDGRPNALFRMALRIARNLALDEARRQRSTPLEEAAEPAHDPTPETPDPLLRRHVAECRERLPKQPARVLGVRIDSGGGEPDEVLAEQLGMQKNTFLQNLSRARKLLAACLEKRGIALGGLR